MIQFGLWFGGDSFTVHLSQIESFLITLCLLQGHHLSHPGQLPALDHPDYTMPGPGDSKRLIWSVFLQKVLFGYFGVDENEQK